jgi:alpha-tubulin suppressor-like RCC1 family protein
MRAVQISVGAENACAVSADGSVYCWGRNNYGQLGADPNTVTLSNIPVKVPGLTAAKSVAVGGDYACALLNSGSVYCWGLDWNGQLGNGSTPSSGGSATPLLVSGLPSSGIAGISAGDSGACVYTTSGALWCWGDNIYSELGSGVTGNFSMVPVNVSLSSVTKLAVGSGIICAIASGSAWCWGDNYQGKAGSPTSSGTVTTPTGVMGLGGASNPQWISTGGDTGCAIIAGGGVDCWGWNNYCPLGNPTVADGAATPSAVNVQGLSTGATAVSVGFLRACAILTDKSLACWGLERYGGLGNGVTGNDLFTCTPYTLTSLGSVSAVSGSGYTSCALRTNGSIACWGSGNMGQIGNGATADATVPADATPW